MRDLGKAIVVVLFIVSIVGGAAGCRYWKYTECRKVGHGVLYCVVQE